MEAAGRDGDQPQAAAGGRRRRPQVMSFHLLDNASRHRYFHLCIHIFTYILYSITILLATLLIVVPQMIISFGRLRRRLRKFGPPAPPRRCALICGHCISILYPFT